MLGLSIGISIFSGVAAAMITHCEIYGMEDAFFSWEFNVYEREDSMSIDRYYRYTGHCYSRRGLDGYAFPHTYYYHNWFSWERYCFLMKCPYCDKEMVLGYIQSSRMLVWDKEKRSGIILPSSNGVGIILTKRFSKTHAIKSYLCKNCNLLLSMLTEWLCIAYF